MPAVGRDGRIYAGTILASMHLILNLKKWDLMLVNTMTEKCLNHRGTLIMYDTLHREL